MSENPILMTQAGYTSHRNKSPQCIGRLYKAGILVMRGRLVDVAASDVVLDELRIPGGVRLLPDALPPSGVRSEGPGWAASRLAEEADGEERPRRSGPGWWVPTRPRQPSWAASEIHRPARPVTLISLPTAISRTSSNSWARSW